MKVGIPRFRLPSICIVPFSSSFVPQGLLCIDYWGGPDRETLGGRSICFTTKVRVCVSLKKESIISAYLSILEAFPWMRRVVNMSRRLTDCFPMISILQISANNSGRNCLNILLGNVNFNKPQTKFFPILNELLMLYENCWPVVDNHGLHQQSTI